MIDNIASTETSGEPTGRVSVGKGLLTMTMDIAGRVSLEEFDATVMEMLEAAKKQLTASFLE